MTFVEVAELTGAENRAEVSANLRCVSRFSEATVESVVFAMDEAALREAEASGAGLILAPLQSVTCDARVLRVKNAKYAFALCGRALAGAEVEPAIHPAAVVHASARLGHGTRVEAGAVIEEGVVVGRDCVVRSRVTLCREAKLGDRVVVQPGAVVGSTGFGYVRDEDTGKYILFPQQGGIVIEDDVEIGANTTIDRGALGETRIGRGTKIDNQVHIGHNCVLGKDVIVAAQVGISGSCTIGDGAVLAGQVGLGDHVTIGADVILGGASGVFPHKQLEGRGEMFMGVPAQPLKEYLKGVAKLRRMK